MPRRPANGFPTTTAAILSLERQGLDEYEVAGRLGIQLGTVRKLKRARGCLVPRTLRKPKLASKVEIPRDIVGELERHALRRDITPQECIRRLLRRALIDELVDAILDDAVSAERQPEARGARAA